MIDHINKIGEPVVGGPGNVEGAICLFAYLKILEFRSYFPEIGFKVFIIEFMFWKSFYESPLIYCFPLILLSVFIS